jgi:hypothetical protein
MTSGRGGHPFAVAVWILCGAVVVASVAGVLGDILSRSYVVDMAAMWPLLVGALMLGLIARWLGRRSPRSRALLPLALFTVLVLGAGLHLSAWERLPSASARLTGPGVEVLSDPTELVAQVVGELELEATEADVAYSVVPIQRGGMVGVPQATETTTDGDLSVRIEAAPDAPSWYRFAGWRIGLSPRVSWRLVLNGEIEADLRQVSISSGAVAGSGSLRLGDPPPTGAGIIVAGDFVVTVPDGAAVTVDGEAAVPSDWATSDERHSSPAAAEGGDAWRLTIQGDTPVTVREG